MTYEYYKSNYDKLTKQEKNSNKEFRTRFLEEAHLEGLNLLKKNMDERVENYFRKRQ